MRYENTVYCNALWSNAELFIVYCTIGAVWHDTQMEIIKSDDCFDSYVKVVCVIKPLKDFKEKAM